MVVLRSSATELSSSASDLEFRAPDLPSLPKLPQLPAQDQKRGTSLQHRSRIPTPPGAGFSSQRRADKLAIPLDAPTTPKAQAPPMPVQTILNELKPYLSCTIKFDNEYGVTCIKKIGLQEIETRADVMRKESEVKAVSMERENDAKIAIMKVESDALLEIMREESKAQIDVMKEESMWRVWKEDVKCSCEDWDDGKW